MGEVKESEAVGGARFLSNEHMSINSELKKVDNSDQIL